MVLSVMGSGCSGPRPAGETNGQQERGQTAYSGADLWTRLRDVSPAAAECTQAVPSIRGVGGAVTPATGHPQAAMMGKHPLGLLLQGATLAPTAAAIFIATQAARVAWSTA